MSELGDRKPWRFRSRLLEASTCAMALIVCWPTAVGADVGIPMLAFVWPASWALLLPVILVEAAVGQRILDVSFVRALKISTLANLTSTLLGVPLTWVAGVAAEMGFMWMISGTNAKWVSALEHLQWPFLLVTAPWLGPEPTPWMLVVASMLLCVPFFFVSVWSEALVARPLLRERSAEQIRRWAWHANLITYGGIVALLLGLLAIVLVRSH